MSRQTKYDLVFPKGGIKCKVHIQKSYESTTVFCQGKEGRQVRTVKVLATGDAKPSDLSDIERLVPWGELESYYPYKDEDGESKLVPIDKKALSSMYRSTSSMQVVGVLDKELIPIHMFDGYHYFMGVQFDVKTKEILETDQKVYTIVYNYLLNRNQYMLVKFISSNREKFAVIHADPESDGLRLSILIHSTYQRERARTGNLCDIPNVIRYGAKLLSSTGLEDVDPESIKDEYEEKVRDYIARYKDSGTSEPVKITITAAKTTEVDILDAIGAL